MEVKVKIQTVVITDEDGGKSYKVRTLRSAEEIAGYIQESEKEEITDKLEHAVIEEINK